jgi:phosphoenolpyruvate carboxykinase (GTP)
MWILDRCEDKVGANQTAIGYTPNPEDINITGLNGVTKETIANLVNVDKEVWKGEIAGIKEFYAKFDVFPDELKDELAKLENALK